MVKTLLPEPSTQDLLFDKVSLIQPLEYSNVMPDLVATVSGEVVIEAGEVIDADWPLPVSDDHNSIAMLSSLPRRPTSSDYQNARSPSSV